MNPFKLLQKLDAWVANRKLPRLKTTGLQDDIRTAKKVAPWIVYLAVGGFALFLVGGILFYLFVLGPRSPLTNPTNQLAVPTIRPTPVEQVYANPWKNLEWLSQKEARELRTKQNVVNFTLLANGGAKYSKNLSVQFVPEKPWARVKPFGITALSVSGTGTQFTYSSQTYNVNVFQPFAFQEEPNLIYIVDAKGQIWGAERSEITLIQTNSVELPLGIVPNGDLTFTLE